MRELTKEKVRKELQLQKIRFKRSKLELVK